MTTPTITLYPDTLPAKGQANAAFDTNVDNFLTWLTATNGPELAAMVTWTQGVADNVLATALAGDLPPLTGKALNYIRANAAEDGGEFRTPAEVLSDIGATAALALKAPLVSPSLTGTPTAPTATAGTNTTQVATTAFVQTSVVSEAALTAADDATLEFTWTGTPSRVEFFFDKVLPSVDDRSLQLTISTDGGSTFKTGASDYDWSSMGVRNSDANARSAALESSAFIRLDISGVGNAAGEYGLSGSLAVLNPAAATLTQNVSDVRYKTLTGGWEMANGLSTYKAATTAVNGIRFAFDTGNISSGTITMKLHY
jgi:hypothetical protein